jgi:ABC-type antimicrobial peptide transport system permease subunit
VKQNQNGDPLISAEGLSVVSLPNIDYPDSGMNVTVRGLSPVGLAMRPKFKITQGETYKPGLRQVIVGEAIAKRYPTAKIGNELSFGSGRWTVVGVFSVGDSAANSEIWVDKGQFDGDFKRGGDSSSLLVQLGSPADIEALKARVDADKNLGAQVLSETEYYRGMTNNFAAQFLQYLGFSVAVIMAIGSAFAATNTMYAAVSRRTREIGTLRALGFSKGSILLSFMLESVFLSLLGGVVGVLLALPVNGLTTGVGNFNTFSDVTFKFQVGFLAIACGLGFSVIIGALGGFLPAWTAARKNIIQAMREI